MKNSTKTKKTRRGRTKNKNPFAIIMTGYYPTTCDDIPNHDCDPCEPREFGRIRSCGFISTSYQWPNGDPTNPSSWQAAIQGGQILVIPFTNGEMPAPSEKTVQGYGDVIEELVNYTFTASVYDPNFTSNGGFYNTMAGRRDFYFFYRTSSQTYITDYPVIVIPKFNVANDLNSEVVWNITVKWVSNQFPEIFPTPDGIFEQCYITGE